MKNGAFASFGMLRARRERSDGVQQCIARPLRNRDVFLDESLVVFLVGEAARDERELVARRERLPHGVFRHRATVAVGTRNEHQDTAQRARFLRRPEAELGLVVVIARRRGLLERSGSRRLRGDRMRQRADDGERNGQRLETISQRRTHRRFLRRIASQAWGRGLRSVRSSTDRTANNSRSSCSRGAPRRSTDARCCRGRS